MLPRKALPEALQVAATEALTILLQADFLVASAIGPQTAVPDAVAFPARFAPQTTAREALGQALQTTSRTVPGTVSKVVPDAPV